MSGWIKMTDERRPIRWANLDSNQFESKSLFLVAGGKIVDGTYIDPFDNRPAYFVSANGRRLRDVSAWMKNVGQPRPELPPGS